MEVCAIRRSVLLLGVTLLASLAVWAQPTSDIAGTVTDTSGAVIPDAEVVVSNPDQIRSFRVPPDFARELMTQDTFDEI